MLGEPGTSEIGVEDDAVNRHRLVARLGNDSEARHKQSGKKVHGRAELAPLYGKRKGVCDHQGVSARGLKHVDSPTGDEYACALRDEALGLVEVVHQVAHHNVVECAVFEGELVHGTDDEATARERDLGERDFFFEEIDPRRSLGFT